MYPGSGEFIAGGPTRVATEVTADGDITMNFARAEIQDVARAVLGEALKLNYAVDPRVQGQITVQTTTPLRRAAVLPTLDALLRLDGATIVESNGLYRIVPLADAQRGSLASTVTRPRGPVGPGFGMHIVPLRHIAAAQIQKVLEPLAPEGTIRHVDTTRNVLVLAGSPQEISALLGTVEAFDTDWMAAMSIGLFPLRSADPKAVARELEAIFSDGQKDSAATLVRFLPVERLNAVLAISARPEYLSRVRDWTERLDRGEDEGTPQLFVYFVRNGPAADLAAVLSSAFSGEPPRISRRTAAQGGVAPTVGAVELRRDNRSLFVTPPGTMSGLSPSPIVTEPQAPQRRATRPGESAPPAPFPFPSADGAAAAEGLDAGGAPPVRIIPDETKNAILIFATPRQYRTIEAAIRRLDVLPLQVVIEATIAEVTLTDQLNFGVQWFLQSGNHRLTFTDAVSGAVDSIFPGFSYVFSAGRNAQFVLNLLASVTDVRVVSAPQVMVMDNQTARLQVGDQVPIPVQQAVSIISPDAPIVNTIQFRDTGVILEVTPRVNPGGPVILDIKQEVSDVARTTTSGIDAPTIQQRRIASTVAVETDQSIALGGLIRSSKNDVRSGIPLLMDIPLLGALFRSTENDERRTELIVLLTPRVVRDSADAHRLTEDLRRRLHNMAPRPSTPL
jgi:general secretion pathway protein D